MANRYFVGGGTGNWNSTTNWSATDGGAPGASFPVSTDDVFLTAASGANTLTVNATSTAKSLTCTAFTGTLAGSSQLTVSGNVTLGASMTISYSGTLIINASSTITSNGVTWPTNLSFNTTTPTYTIVGDLTITGTFTQTSGSLITFNGDDIYCNGNVVVNASTGVSITGTSDFFFSGTGTWSGSQAFDCNITITGTYTLSGTVGITGACVFTCTSGTLTTTGSTLRISVNITVNCTINTNQILENLSIATGTLTLSQALTLTGALTYLNNTTITINGFTINIGGDLTLLSTTLAVGTTSLILDGTGIWSGAGVLRNNLTINTSYIITISGSVAYNTGTLTYTSGSVITTGSTLTIAASSTLTTDGIVWNNIIISGTSTITNNSLLTITNNLSYASGSIITFAGTSGWTTANFYILTSNNISHTLVATKTYTVTSYFESIATTSSLKDSLISSIPGTKAIFTLNYGATQNVGYTNATDIDSSLGQTIWTFNGVVTTTNNWNVFTSGSGGVKKYIF